MEKAKKFAVISDDGESCDPQDVSFPEEVRKGHPDGYVGNPFKVAVPRQANPTDLTAWLAGRNREVPKGDVGDDYPTDLPPRGGDMSNRGS